MNNNIVTKLQNGLGKAITYFILLSCVAIFVVYLVQRFGAQYAEDKIKEQLDQSGLAPFVQYGSVHLDPFTLTPSLENVSFGNENAPWLRFARISFNSYPINYPDLDVDFWIQESPIDSLSRDTRRLMRAAGVDTLLGKGSFTSKVEGEKVSSQFKLDIKDIGKLNLFSNINVLDHNIAMSDLRSDVIASFALGQPEALPIIYGDVIELHSLKVEYEESGLIAHLLPKSALSRDSNENQLNGLKYMSQALGLAPANSTEAEQIAETLLTFLKQPEKLNLTMSPPSAISLKELALLANEGTLYKDSKMTLSND
ncbi:hypothetical protein EBI01_14120 [Marinomonas rhizomae]|uniref:DUF2125 domain-containing protein n=1 Tax=Marinomonas rhizomae TaxID=491948 RepID=A0A366J1Q0_9GAMM|nr:hypothetical protein [Marinomonas rhizomae]RBP80055.1 hypothetical protein DFP80_112111 [Marinomonas rhizomae]RNF71978.1 hypothetical protein EBI01_14120 [Marinomonas rhizomae]